MRRVRATDYDRTGFGAKSAMHRHMIWYYSTFRGRSWSGGGMPVLGGLVL